MLRFSESVIQVQDSGDDEAHVVDGECMRAATFLRVHQDNTEDRLTYKQPPCPHVRNFVS